MAVGQKENPWGPPFLRRFLLLPGFCGRAPFVYLLPAKEISRKSIIQVERFLQQALRMFCLQAWGLQKKKTTKGTPHQIGETQEVGGLWGLG